MDYVPAPSEQEWLLEHLREVIAYAGRRRFLDAPIVEPSDEFFPDKWTPGPKGVTRLARRVLRHAGMGKFGVHLELFTGETAPAIDPRGRTFSHRHLMNVAAWYSSLDDGRCHLGVDTSNLDNPPDLAAILCHEVAHAFRDWKGLAYEARHEDEPLTDLTSVYLGFGILSTNLSYRYRATSAGWSHGSGGYLSPVELSFLLAAQAVARGTKDAGRRKISSFLEANQAAFFRASSVQLDRDRVALLRKLGLEGAGPAAAKGFNRGLPVFRLRGGWFRRPRCSDPDCGAVLPVGQPACSGCGGSVKGEVGSAAEAKSREAEIGDDPNAADAILEILRKG